VYAVQNSNQHSEKEQISKMDTLKNKKKDLKDLLIEKQDSS